MDGIDWKQMIIAFIGVFAILFGWQYYTMKKQGGQTTAPEAVEQKQVTPTDTTTSAEEAPVTPAAPATKEEAAATTDEAWAWRVARPTQAATDVVLGGAAVEVRDYKASIRIDGATASIERALLNEHKLQVKDKEPGYPVVAESRTLKGSPFRGLLCQRLQIVGRPERFDLSKDVWSGGELVVDEDGKQTVSYRALIEDEAGTGMLEVVKTFSYRPGDYELDYELAFVNLGAEGVDVESLVMMGPAGLPREDPRHDRRRVQSCYAEEDGDFKIERVDLAKIIKKKMGRLDVEQADAGELQWFAVANKFFATILAPQPNADSDEVDYLVDAPVKAMQLKMLDPTAWPDDDIAGAYADDEIRQQDTLGLFLRVAPAGTLEQDERSAMTFKCYLGPIDKDVFALPQYAALNYQKLIYSRSCFCSFDWLTLGLLKLMGGVYKVVGNYGIAVILLVLIVRICLHPITKKSQISMAKMGKLGPQMEELRKKYGNNQAEMQRKTMELYKEHGIAGSFMLGCLPMFLQMPIWIGLYTAVDSNVALRHHGLFPAGWHWLTDLSAPDRLIPFSLFGLKEPIMVPLIGGIDAFNLLPILLCIALFLQMKLSPQNAMSNANPQQASQQKMMMFMMPIMMLLFLYSGPSGLNLYIMTSTFAGVIESHIVRKHIRERDEAATKSSVEATRKVGASLGPKKKKPKGPIRYR